MLACIACSKRLNDGSQDASDEDAFGTPRSLVSRNAIENLTPQKDTPLQLSGANRPSAVSNLNREEQLQRSIDSEAGSGSGTPLEESSSSTATWCIMDASSKGDSLSDRLCTNTPPTGTPIFHTSSGSVETMMDEKDDEETKEWISQVEPGVIITLVSLKGGRNELKRIRFSREIFNHEQAQGWWAENCDKIMELYNVHAHTKDKPAAVSNPPRSEDERDSKIRAESGTDSPVTPPMQNKTLLPRGSQASETSSFRDTDRSDHLQSKDNSSKQGHNREYECVEEDEPGVHVTIHCYPTGSRQIKRVKFRILLSLPVRMIMHSLMRSLIVMTTMHFSREKFSETQAKLWWEENRVRIHAKYAGPPI